MKLYKHKMFSDWFLIKPDDGLYTDEMGYRYNYGIEEVLKEYNEIVDSIDLILYSDVIENALKGKK